MQKNVYNTVDSEKSAITDSQTDRQLYIIRRMTAINLKCFTLFVLKES